MSDVEVQFDGNVKEQATLLLAAAEELGLGQEVVKTMTGGFVVPAEVNEKAFAPRVSPGNTKSATKQKPQE